jgi:hypothetical protein
MYQNEMNVLFDFYNERLKGVGIGEDVYTAAQLSHLERLSCAVSGVGMSLLSFWLLGRRRAKGVYGEECPEVPKK